MSSMPAEQNVWDRMIFALVGSLAVHFVVVLLIQGRPMHAEGTNAAPLIARLEPVKDIRPDASSVEAPVQPEIQPAADKSAAGETAPADPVAAPSSSVAPAAPRLESTVLDIPVIRDPTYYAARFLDEYPKPLRPIEPRFPEQATISRISGGTVTLLLLIDEDGVLRDVSVVEAQPESIFDEAALAAFRDMRFAPARKDGRAVRSRVLVTVGFESNDRSSAR